MAGPDRLRRMIPVALGGWILALGVAAGPAPEPVRAVEPVPAEAAAEAAQAQGYIGTEDCAGCHDEEYENYRRSVHFQTETGELGAGGCESCHGPGEAHFEDPEVVSMLFGASDDDHSARDRAGQCLGCHADDAATFDYRSSSHLEGAIDCAACHRTHEGVGPDTLRADAGLESCLGCHQELRAQFNLNERHRVLEGMVTCADCHEQHGQSTRARLGGFQNESCYGCHTDKQGPFLYEHLSVRVEGCTACHQPHGSVNRHMLFTQNMGELCYSCHIEVPGFHTATLGDSFRFNEQTNCVNCHSTIHGSNLHPRFLR